MKSTRTRQRSFVLRCSSFVLALAFAAVAANADRSITVTSLSDGNATLDFGATDGNAYTLAWGYGDEDGGSTTNAWDNFAILGTVAAGDTTRTVALPAGWANTVTHLRFFLLAPETLPYATRLEYIESDGSQWINTQVRGKVGVETEIDVACVTMGDNTILGCRKDGNDTRFYPVHWANNKWWKGWLRGGVYWSTRDDIVLGTRYHVRSVFKSGEQAFYVDGVSKGTPTSETSTFDSGLDMYLFAANKYGTDVFQQAKARIYSAKIWLDGNLKRDFVPCRDGNGVACLYDLVSGEYFRNGASGSTFAAGPEIAPGLEVAASSALCEPPARSIAIASKTGSTITLAIGPANGNTYTLYMAYGAADGGTSPSGWDEFEELGEIDSGDNDYTTGLPAGWGDTVKALRFFLLRPDDTVASRTETLIYVNELIVEERYPTSNGSDVEYDIVRLRDTLRLWGGTLTSTVVVVDGPAGNLEIDGGTLSPSSRLSLDPALETENEYATLLVLRQGATTLEHAMNANTNVAARIHFLGGWLKCTSFSGKPLCSANGGKWILEGTPSHPIRFGDLGLQRMDWLTGDGSIETRGHCDVVFDDSAYNVANDWRGTIWLNTSNTVWNHTGNLVLSNAIDVICTSDDCLPSGPQTGGIEMKWVNRAGPPPPRLNLNGHSVAVNGIDGRSGEVVVTNSSSTVATLRIGEGDTVGSITNLVLHRGNINLVKRGAETNFVSLSSSSLAALRVEAGTLVVTGTAADALRATSVTVAEGATLVIDGAGLFAPEIYNDGAIERLGGGVLGAAVGKDGSADTVLWDDLSLPADTVLAKVGSNRAIVQTVEAIGADIDVRGGELVFSGRTCTNEWYRFVFNGTTYGATQVAIGDLRIYPDTNTTENLALNIGADGYSDGGADPSTLARNQCVSSFKTTNVKPSGKENSVGLWTIRNAFNGEKYNAVLSESSYNLNNTSVWIAFRMAAGNNRVQSYRPVESYLDWWWHPSAWLFQTSPDGVNWTTVDSQRLSWSDASHSYGSMPFVIKGFLADGAAGFDPTANVKVASGAALDAAGVAGGQAISRLTIDMTAGAGTIRGVTIAEGGVLDLLNIPEGLSLHDVTIPVTLLDITDGRNFSSWTVLVDGAPARVGIPKWDGETLSLFDGATLIQLR